MSKMVTLLGLGNPLLKDDGIGLRVIQEINKTGLPRGVLALEAEGSVLKHWDVLTHSKYLIIIDAFCGGSAPGTIYLLQTDEDNYEKEAVFPHDHDLWGVVRLLRHFGTRPEIIIVGVEPKEISYSTDLSSEVSAKIPFIIKIIQKLYTRYLHASSIIPPPTTTSP